MKQKKQLLIAISLFCISAYSQDMEYAKTIIRELSSSHFKGRGYTSDGNKKAAYWLGKEFKKWELLPFGDDYTQHFDIAVNTFPGKMEVNINNEKLRPGIDYLVDASSPSIKGTFEVLKISRKELTSKAQLLQWAQNAAGKVICIDNSIDTSEDKALTKTINDNIAILKNSAQIASKAVLIFSPDKLTWTCSVRQSIRPIITVHGTPSFPDQAKVELNIEARYVEQYPTQNIAGYIKGQQQPDSFIVMTAHYDHLGQMGKEIFFPGANDNASGVAMMLNMAQYYHQNPQKYSMVFIALSAEEAGILGAKFFSEHPLFDLSKVKFMVNFDMAGTGEEGIRVVNGSVFQSKFDLLTKINNEQHLLPRIDIRGEACISDHCMFYKKGVPCFYIYTQGGSKAYHDLNDTAENLSLAAFPNYFRLMTQFFDRIE